MLQLNEAKDNGVAINGVAMARGELYAIIFLLQTYNHGRTSSLNFYRPNALPDAQPTASYH